MKFYSKDFLIEHCQSIFSFYDKNVIDENGGYFQNFLDNGEVFNPNFKQLVSSTRIVINYANGAKILNRPHYLEIAQHGLNFVEQVHWQESAQGFAWTLDNNVPLDMTQQAYGYAFVLLMYASVLNAGLIDNDEKLVNIYQLLEARFWQDEYQLYADEISESGELSAYRGQNANMHLCEAMIAAYEASNNILFLKRAEVIAKNICCRQASMTNDLVWEHYTTDFQPDWAYNKADPKNLYRPWGFQPGHQTEWTKLLIKLSQHSSSAWLLPKAKQLFDIAFKVAWDHEDGGLIYGFDPKEQWCDTDKYFWVQAESFAAAAMLYNTSEDEKYLKAYEQLWEYSWQHFVDHEHGAWFRLLTKNNMKYSNEKSSVGAKCDYHTLGACFDVLNDMKEY